MLFGRRHRNRSGSGHDDRFRDWRLDQYILNYHYTSDTHRMAAFVGRNCRHRRMSAAPDHRRGDRGTPRTVRPAHIAPGMPISLSSRGTSAVVLAGTHDNRGFLLPRIQILTMMSLMGTLVHLGNHGLWTEILDKHIIQERHLRRYDLVRHLAGVPRIIRAGLHHRPTDPGAFSHIAAYRREIADSGYDHLGSHSQDGRDGVP